MQGGKTSSDKSGEEAVPALTRGSQTWPWRRAAASGPARTAAGWPWGPANNPLRPSLTPTLHPSRVQGPLPMAVFKQHRSHALLRALMAQLQYLRVPICLLLAGRAAGRRPSRAGTWP